MKLHKAVRLTLEAVSRRELPANWMGFDDADIKWFLHKHKDKQGPGLDWLRAEYQQCLDYDYKNNPNTVLFFFPVTQEQAQQILRDISPSTPTEPTT